MKSETPHETLTNHQLNQGIYEIDSNPVFAGKTQKAYQEIANCLDPMLGRLPELYREAILQIEIGGLTQVALDANLGLSVSAVKLRAQRGRKSLKNVGRVLHSRPYRDNRLIDYQVKTGNCSSCGSQNQNATNSCHP